VKDLMSMDENIKPTKGNEVEIEDASGHLLQIKKLTALDRLRLFKAIGSTLAQNAPYLGLATLAASVTAIDKVPIPAPVNEAQIETLIRKLGDTGISAVAEVLVATVTPAMERATQGN